MDAAFPSGAFFQPGDKVRITEGIFEGREGTVRRVDQSWPKATVQLEIFGRLTPVEVLVSQLRKT